MDGGDAKAEIGEFCATEPSLCHAAHQFALRREFSNAFNEILIAFAILGDQLTHPGDQHFRIAVVKGAEQGIFDFAEFEAEKASAGL